MTKSNKADGHLQEHENRDEALLAEGANKAIDVDNEPKEEVGEQIKFGQQDTKTTEEQTPKGKEEEEQQSAVSKEPAYKEGNVPEEQESAVSKEPAYKKDSTKGDVPEESNNTNKDQQESEIPSDTGVDSTEKEDSDNIGDYKPKNKLNNEQQLGAEGNKATEEEEIPKEALQGGSSEPDRMIGQNKVRAFKSTQYN